MSADRVAELVAATEPLSHETKRGAANDASQGA
jgi:hypothetical protein